jgi:uncharacterized protein YbjT (DUF2867 family)
MRIVLIGASGFFGEHLLRTLTSDQHQCLVLTRSVDRRSRIGMMPGVELVQADVFDKDALSQQCEGADAVISMAGILNESGGGNGFHKVHVELVKNIVNACRQAKVSRLLHVSALNAGMGSSKYLKSKGEAESWFGTVVVHYINIFYTWVFFFSGLSLF